MFLLAAALIESFNGEDDAATTVQSSVGDSASLSLPLVLQLGISEPSQPALQASAPPPAPISMGPSSQQVAFGSPTAVLQSPEVPVPHSTPFAASHQDFLQPTQAPPQPIVQGLSVVAGASAPAPPSATEPLPAVVQTVPVGANSVLTSNPTITITPSQSTAILQSSIVMGEQNLQWILNGATGSPQNQEQMVSVYLTLLLKHGSNLSLSLTVQELWFGKDKLPELVYFGGISLVPGASASVLVIVSNVCSAAQVVTALTASQGR